MLVTHARKGPPDNYCYVHVRIGMPLRLIRLLSFGQTE